MTKPLMTLWALGILFTSVPGLFPESLRVETILCMGLGLIFYTMATFKGGARSSGSALALIVASNLGFWFSYGLWRLRLNTAGPSPRVGVDSYAGVIAIWFINLLLFSLYEGVVFLWGAIANRGRAAALVGMPALAVQVATSVRLAYSLLQGV